ncbi:MAG TPA: efflux RND transporter permease subunit [Candidatus Limnocylindria bacterium]|nr:efflux RND transporter permease subunit [Candidatus Limnocylindria bacterium]
MIQFFLRRPVFAGVASIIVLIAGLVALPSLPIAQYPQVAPPEVSVSTVYIGANAEAVESAVTTPLEEAINGVEGMRYMTSTSGNDGTSTITVTFNLDRNLDAAQADVQNAVLSATGRLPAIVQQTGVTVKKTSSANLLGVAFMTDGRMSQGALSDFVEHQVMDTLKRVRGVADIQAFGLRRYAMRLWLDPRRLMMEGLTASDVITALQSQNQQVAGGAVGAPPTTGNQLYQVELNADGRLTTPEQFSNIIIKTTPDGGYVRVRDVGHVELGAEDYTTAARFNGHQSVGFVVVQQQDANALDLSNSIRASLQQMQKTFPPGVSYAIPFDATLFVRESIKEVVLTLAFAILLVVLVIYAFIQDWKMALVPMITIPVSLIGTLALMKLLGFSINTLSLFGLTLATGLVVDDAIVVIENIARFVQEKKMPPLAAASAAMREISGAVIATSLVLLAVFIPVAFFPGSTGLLYKQFAMTIACSIAISLFTALTLAPPLSAILLGEEHAPTAPIFRLINWTIAGLRRSYHGLLPTLLRMRAPMLGVFALALGLTAFQYTHTPTSFIPDEDQGYLIVVLQTPTGTSSDYERRVSERLSERIRQAVPEAEGVFTLDGFGFTGNAPSRGVAFIPLKPWDERNGPTHTFQAILARLYPIVSSEPDAQVFAFNPPSVQGIGNFGGFQFQVLDQNNVGFPTASAAVNRLIGAVNGDPHFAAAFTSFRDDAPQFNLAIDREKTEQLGVPFGTLAQTLGVFEGSEYVNDFNLNNRAYRVYVQADAPYRSAINGLDSMYVRSPQGGLIPLSTLMTPSSTKVPTEITHFNLYRSIEVDGAPRPGVGSGDVIASMQKLADQVLPAGMGYSWYGLTRDQIEGGNFAALVFALGIVFVFLVLAAQYENFWDPFVILLSVPLALLGALWAIGLRHFPSDVFVQVGFVMLIGLASKNAILIVEFANQLRESGMNPIAAVARAAETRLRPIIMTSLAFIFGILPLVFATGAGSASRSSLGTAVLGGMLVSTALNLVFVPVIYVAVTMLRERVAGHREPRRAAEPQAEPVHANGAQVVGWMEVTDGDRTEWKPVYATPVGEAQTP